jgi:hypothetical protein
MAPVRSLGKRGKGYAQIRRLGALGNCLDINPLAKPTHSLHNLRSRRLSSLATLAAKHVKAAKITTGSLKKNDKNSFKSKGMTIALALFSSCIIAAVHALDSLSLAGESRRSSMLHAARSILQTPACILSRINNARETRRKAYENH